MSRVVVLGFTEHQIERLLESAAVDDPARVLIVLNVVTPALVEAASTAGLPWVALESFAVRDDDWLMLGVLRPATKRLVVQAFTSAFGDRARQFAPVVHPFGSISRTASVAHGALLEPGVILAPRADLAPFVSVNRNVSIGHHTRIGAWSMINPGVNIAGTCEIEEGVTLGMGVSVFDGVRIGQDTVIGGGSVVTRDIPAGVLAYGNPCRVVRDL